MNRKLASSILFTVASSIVLTFGYTPPVMVAEAGQALSGADNNADGDNAVVVGDEDNHAVGDYSFIGGGSGNYAKGNYSFISGGSRNYAVGEGSFIGGGSVNYAGGKGSFIGGGSHNYAEGENSFICGGESNRNEGESSFVGAGMWNKAEEDYSFVGGGEDNTASGLSSFVGAGKSNKASGTTSFVGAGASNKAEEFNSVIVGGALNKAEGEFSIIVGGQNNHAGGENSIVIGGQENYAEGNYSFIGGGQENHADGENSIVVSGSGNRVMGEYASVIGGRHNEGSGEFSFIGIGKLNTLTAGSEGGIISGGIANYLDGANSSISGSQNFLKGKDMAVTGSGNQVGGDDTLRAKLAEGAAKTNDELEMEPNDQNVSTWRDELKKAAQNAAAVENAFVYGNKNMVNGSNVGILGSGNTVTGSDAVALGQENTVKHDNVYVLGSNVTSGAADVVILGTGSSDNGRTQTVSVGARGAERQIINVKAGKETTDAANVGQLTTVIKDNTGNVKFEITDLNEGQAGKGHNYSIRADADLSGLAKNTDGLKFGGDDAEFAEERIITRQLNQRLDIVGGATGALSNGNIAVINEDGKLTVKLAKDLKDLNSVEVGPEGSRTVVNKNNITVDGTGGSQTVINGDSVTSGSFTAGDTMVDDKGLTIKGGPSVTKDGIDTAGKKITNVAAGEADTDAVNYGQLKEQLDKADSRHTTVKVEEGSIITVKDLNDNPGKGHDYEISIDDSNLAKKDDGLRFKGDDDTVIDKRLSDGKPLEIKGGARKEDLTENNIGVVSGDGGKSLNVQLSKHLKGLESITVGKDGSDNVVKITTGNITVGGDTTIGKSGLTIKDGPSVTKDGIDAGNMKITNVAPGEDDTDAVNVSQLRGLGDAVANVDNRLNKVGAGAAALAALHPVDFDARDKLDMAAGWGHYKGQNSMALGAFYRPDERTLFSMGGTFGNGENMINAGFTFKLDKLPSSDGSMRPIVSKVQLVNEVRQLKQDNLELKKSNDSVRKENADLRSEVNELKKTVEMIKQMMKK